MTCPKCHGRMVGPIYHYHRDLHYESLVYRCTTCGYRKSTPTKEEDQQPQERARDILKTLKART